MKLEELIHNMARFHLTVFPTHDTEICGRCNVLPVFSVGDGWDQVTHGWSDRQAVRSRLREVSEQDNTCGE